MKAFKVFKYLKGCLICCVVLRQHSLLTRKCISTSHYLQYHFRNHLNQAYHQKFQDDLLWVHFPYCQATEVICFSWEIKDSLWKKQNKTKPKTSIADNYRDVWKQHSPNIVLMDLCCDTVTSFITLRLIWLLC